MDWTVFRLMAWAESYFRDHAIDSPRLTSELLLAHSLGLRRLDLYLQYDRPLESRELQDFKQLIRRRVAREPVAYIIGERGFFEDVFDVGPGVLIPRPDTEILVETAIRLIRSLGRAPRVLELGVGSGAVLISVAKSCPAATFWGTDHSPLALDTTRSNAHLAPESRFHLFQGSWLDAVVVRPFFDVILSNPPYIPTREISTLSPEIRDHEPFLALDGGPDGLDSIRQILHQAGPCLMPGGHLLVEIGHDQKHGVSAIQEGCPAFDGVSFIRDLGGKDRVAHLKKKID